MLRSPFHTDIEHSTPAVLNTTTSVMYDNIPKYISMYTNKSYDPKHVRHMCTNAGTFKV